MLGGQQATRVVSAEDWRPNNIDCSISAEKVLKRRTAASIEKESTKEAVTLVVIVLTSTPFLFAMRSFIQWNASDYG